MKTFSLLFRASCIAFFSALLLVSCGGGGGGTPPIVLHPTPTPVPSPGLRQVAAARQVLVGAAVDPSHLGEALYASTLGREYSVAEPENAMKFGLIHPRPDSDPNPYDFSPADQIVAFAQANNMSVRGHTFVWHQQVPDWLTSGIANGTYDAADLSSILQNHITAVGENYAGKVYAWDVVNEAFSDNPAGALRSTIWYDQPGIGYAGQGTKYIEQAFVWAHAADPDAKLFYNDYGFETGGAKADAIYAMASDFKDRGVPLHGIGFQLHVALWFNNPAVLTGFANTLKRFSDLGLETHITEFDVALNGPSPSNTDLNQQAEIYAAVTRTCLQTPNCTLVQTWGFTDKYSWIPWFTQNAQGWALPFDANYNKKPAYNSMYSAFVTNP